MLHPAVASANAKMLYNELVQEADLRRQIKLLERNNPSFFTRFAMFVTNVFAELAAEAVPATTGNTAT